MKKNLFYYLFAMICSVALFASCSDDDDEVTGLTIDQVVGTFTGQLEVLNQSIPGTSIFVTKVDANTVKVELKDFKFSGLTIGDISAECKVALDREGDDFDLNGQATLTVAALGNIELPISITGEVDAKELDIDINITNVPAKEHLSPLIVKSTGKVTTGLPGNTPGAVGIDTSSRAAALFAFPKMPFKSNSPSKRRVAF